MDTHPFMEASENKNSKGCENLCNKTFRSVKEEIKMHEYRKTSNAHKLVALIFWRYFMKVNCRFNATSTKTLCLLWNKKNIVRFIW